MAEETKTEQPRKFFDVEDALDMCLRGAEKLNKIMEEEKRKEKKAKREKRKN